MEPDDPRGEAPPAGFHTFADDTPRMSARPHRDIGATPEPVAAGGMRRPAIVAIGAVLAIAAGVLVAHGDFRRPGSAQPKASIADAPRPMALEVAKPKAPPLPAQAMNAEPLEVLPPDMAAHAQSAPAREAVLPIPRPTPIAPPEPPPQAETHAPPPPPHEPPPPAPQPPAPAVAAADAVATAPEFTRPAFACSRVRSLAEDMVCHDRRLAAADRRLTRAFADALASGADEEALREDQADWLAIREDAARQSPEAVASIYRQRIRELEAIADGRPF
jgi:uncharacterized protein YecT (DUF1311 family)